MRGGHLPERQVMTEIGPAPYVSQVRYGEVTASNPGRIRFTPAIRPPLHAPLEVHRDTAADSLLSKVTSHLGV
jgi:hypothetical protein